MAKKEQGVNNMPKINTIVKVEKKELKGCTFHFPKHIDECNQCRRQDDGRINYNQGQEDYGNKSVGLDVDEIRKVIIKELPEYKLTEGDKINRYRDGSYPIHWRIATALKDNENKIIVEAKEK